MDFIAIDFETANHRPGSACQLAAVVVSGGQVVDQKMWMIKPRPFFFSARNIDVHGIRPHQVEHEPEFCELWEDIRSYVCDGCLIAHNASFDLGVLLGCLKVHRLDVPSLQFSCTRLIARAAWPGRNGYGLKRLADWLGIQFRHHDALEDSLTCAKILLAAAATTSSSTLEQLESKLKLSRGSANASGYHGATKLKRASRAYSARSSAGSRVGEAAVNYVAGPSVSMAQAANMTIDLQRLFIRAEFLRRLAGKQVVFTGQMKQVSREDAERLAKKLGATLHDQVSMSTDIVVIGSTDERTVLAGRIRSVKEQAAKKLQSEGHGITLMTEADLIGLVTHGGIAF